MKKNPYKKIINLFLILFGLLLFTFGLGYNSFSVVILTSVLAFSFMYYLSLNKKIVYPAYFTEYKVFLIIAAVSLFWSFDPARSLYYLTLFFVGGLILLVFYNSFDAELALVNLVIVLGIVFLGLYFVDFAIGKNSVDSLSIYLPITPSRNHNHIGDFWVMALLVIWDKFIIKRTTFWHYILVLLGFYALAVSQSRSAIVSLTVGFFYIFKNKLNSGVIKLTLVILLSFVVIFFIYTGQQKTIIFSRPYMISVFEEFTENPYGIGIGNFGILSVSDKVSPSAYSAYTHNIFLEMISGMGVYALAFVYWFIRVAKEIFWVNRIYSIYKALFLALTVNFLFDYTYFLPVMFILWFSFLGLALKKPNS